MSDEEIRTLEHRAQLDRSVLPALARALERAGRPREALDTWLATRDSEEGQRALASHPSWSHPNGDAGATRSVAVPLWPHAPRIAWVARAPDSSSRPVDALLASPHGVVLGSASGTVVHDPRDGSRLARLPAAREDLALEGRWLLVRHGTALALHDLVTGAAHEHRIPELPELAGDCLVADRDRVSTLESGGLVARALAPGLPVLWRSTLDSRPLRLTTVVAVATATPDLLIAATFGRPARGRPRSTIAGLTREGGALLWDADLPGVVEELHADSHGVVALVGEDVFAFSLDGRPLWDAPASGTAVEALAREHLIETDVHSLLDSVPAPTVVRARATGEVVRTIEPPVFRPVAFEGGFVAHRADGTLVSFDATGSPLWETPRDAAHPDLGRLQALAFAVDRLFAVTEDGSLVAWSLVVGTA